MEEQDVDNWKEGDLEAFLKKENISPDVSKIVLYWEEKLLEKINMQAFINRYINCGS